MGVQQDVARVVEVLSAKIVRFLFIVPAIALVIILGKN